MQKALERSTKLHFNFTDFKSVFDTFWKKLLCKMMRAIDINKKIIKHQKHVKQKDVYFIIQHTAYNADIVWTCVLTPSWQLKEKINERRYKKKKRSRKPKTWTDIIKEHTHLPVTTVEKCAQSCIKWKRLVNTKWVESLYLCVLINKVVVRF